MTEVSKTLALKDWIAKSFAQLEQIGITSARLDVELLATHVLDRPRTWLHAHPETELSATQLRKFDELLKRRLAGEPLAYILGSKEFYGRNFMVNKDVLVPRPESESFIELIKTLPEQQKFIDIGTGSGILAITSVLERPIWSGIATDISPQALKVAQKNAAELGAKNLVFRVQNLLVDEDEDYDVVLANLPYVPQNLSNKADIAYEPPVALFAGKNGLDVYRQLFYQLASRDQKPRYVLTESLETQHPDLKRLAMKAGYKLVETDGLVQLYETD